MKYKIMLSEQAYVFLKRNREERIKRALLLLSNTPLPKGVKKIKGESNLFRIRVGKYRIIYKVYFNEKIIRIILIDKRSRVYKRM